MGSIESHRQAALEAGRKAKAHERRARLIDKWSAGIYSFVTGIEVKDETAQVHLSAKEFVVAVATNVALELTGGIVLKAAAKLLKPLAKRGLGAAKRLLGGKAGKVKPKGKPRAGGKKPGKAKASPSGGKAGAPSGRPKPSSPKGTTRTARAGGAKPKAPAPPPVRQALPGAVKHLQETVPGGTGKLGWRPTREAVELAASHGDTIAHQDARGVVSYHFYAETMKEWGDAEIYSHMHGIDFTKPVTVGPPPPLPEKLVQWMYGSQTKPGQYFGLQGGLEPTNFGVEGSRLSRVTGEFEQRAQQLVPVNPGRDPLGPNYLRSTAEGVVTDWTAQPVRTVGGVEQVFVPSLEPASKPFLDFPPPVRAPSTPPRAPRGPAQAAQGVDWRYGNPDQPPPPPPPGVARESGAVLAMGP